jgi:hypothetical protein
MYATQFTETDRLTRTKKNRSRISREIGYRTKEKIFFKRKKEDDRVIPISQQIVKHQYVIEKPGQPKFIIKFNNP